MFLCFCKWQHYVQHFWQYPKRKFLVVSLLLDMCVFFLFRFGPVKYTFLAEVLVPSLYCHCVKIVIKAYQTRFFSFNQEVFKSMCWLNQAKWNLCDKHGLKKLSFLADHYRDILKEVGFDNAYLKSEWKLFKHMDMVINTIVTDTIVLFKKTQKTFFVFNFCVPEP